MTLYACSLVADGNKNSFIIGSNIFWNKVYRLENFIHL